MLRVNVRLFNSLDQFGGQRPLFAVSLSSAPRVVNVQSTLPVPFGRIYSGPVV